jgi:hypothetical protein
MSLWQTISDDDSSGSDNEIESNEIVKEQVENVLAPLSTREAQKALRRETNST